MGRNNNDHLATTMLFYFLSEETTARREDNFQRPTQLKAQSDTQTEAAALEIRTTRPQIWKERLEQGIVSTS